METLKLEREAEKLPLIFRSCLLGGTYSISNKVWGRRQDTRFPVCSHFKDDGELLASPFNSNLLARKAFHSDSLPAVQVKSAGLGESITALVASTTWQFHCDPHRLSGHKSPLYTL